MAYPGVGTLRLKARTFKQWARASFSALRIAIDRRRREVGA